MTKYTLGDFKVTPEMTELVNKVLSSGRLSYGEYCAEFEQKFAMRHARIFGVLSNSGTSSLVVALQTLKEIHNWQDGDEVIVPAITFVATVNAVLHCNLKPILVDVDVSTYNIDVMQIEKKITSRTRCIIAVHMFGQPAYMPTIMSFARLYNLKVIEDSCEAMGVSIRNDPVGSWGDIACFSTYVGHIITAGVGGISITNDDMYAKYMRSLVNHGIVTESLPTGERYDPTFLGRKFVFDKVGHSFRITEMEAALLLPQLVDLDKNIETRQRNAVCLNEIFKKHSDQVQTPLVIPDCEHAYMMYPLLLYNEESTRLIEYLRINDIEVRRMMPLTDQPCYNFLPFLFPVANRINYNGLYIGCHPLLQDDQFEYLEEVVDKWFFNMTDSNLKDIDFNERSKSKQ